MNRFDNYHKPQPLAWLMASLFAVLVVGCSSGPDLTAPGTLGVFLTDAPACGFSAVNVTVVKVRVHQSSTASDTDPGWADLTLNPARKINLLNLTNGVLEDLGQIPLPPGHYTQVRLVLDPNTGAGLANSVVPASGVEAPLITPSAVQSGIKLINEFDVPSGQRVDLVLDFDACKSIVTRGNGTYSLKPVIRIIPFALNGIDGFVASAVLSSNVLVTAQQNGAIVASTAPDATGEFFLARVAPGNYDVVLTADGRATGVIAGVPIPSTTSVVNVSNTANPITLPVSATHSILGNVTLNPANATIVAYATAKQTFGTGPTVTVKSVAADDSTVPPGAYALASLPIGAPLLGQYSTLLPISLVAQSGVAGTYTVEASASGYQVQSANADISAGDVTRTFILVP